MRLFIVQTAKERPSSKFIFPRFFQVTYHNKGRFLCSSSYDPRSRNLFRYSILGIKMDLLILHRQDVDLLAITQNLYRYVINIRIE